MTLKERWQAEESKIGKVLKDIVAKGLIVVTVIGGMVDFAVGLPQEWVPSWVKTTIIIAALVSHVAGKMTVKDEK